MLPMHGAGLAECAQWPEAEGEFICILLTSVLPACEVIQEALLVAIAPLLPPLSRFTVLLPVALAEGTEAAPVAAAALSEAA